MRKRTVSGGPSAVQLVFAASLPGRWLGYACPDLDFGQAIATAIPCAPARRPDSPIRRHRPGSLVRYPGYAFTDRGEIAPLTRAASLRARLGQVDGPP